MTKSLVFPCIFSSKFAIKVEIQELLFLSGERLYLGGKQSLPNTLFFQTLFFHKSLLMGAIHYAEYFKM